MLNDQDMGSPNLLGLLAGIVTIIILGGTAYGVIWMVVTMFSPWFAH